MKHFKKLALVMSVMSIAIAHAAANTTTKKSLYSRFSDSASKAAKSAAEAAKKFKIEDVVNATQKLAETTSAVATATNETIAAATEIQRAFKGETAITRQLGIIEQKLDLEEQEIALQEDEIANMRAALALMKKTATSTELRKIQEAEAKLNRAEQIAHEASVNAEEISRLLNSTNNKSKQSSTKKPSRVIPVEDDENELEAAVELEEPELPYVPAPTKPTVVTKPKTYEKPAPRIPSRQDLYEEDEEDVVVVPPTLPKKPTITQPATKPIVSTPKKPTVAPKPSTPKPNLTSTQLRTTVKPVTPTIKDLPKKPITTSTGSITSTNQKPAVKGSTTTTPASKKIKPVVIEDEEVIPAHPRPTLLRRQSTRTAGPVSGSLEDFDL